MRSPISKENLNKFGRTTLYTLIYATSGYLLYPILGLKKSTTFEKELKIDPNYKPKVAVIIPARNKGPYIYEVLKSIIKQTYLPSRIMVTNDYSTDNTLDEISKFANKYFGGITCTKISDDKEICKGNKRFKNLDFILINHTKQNLGKQRSLNEMIKMLDENEYELTATIDADTKLHSKWLETMIPYHSDPRVAATYGWVHLWDEKSNGFLKFSRMIEYLFLLPFYRRLTNPNSHWTMSGSNILYKTSILKRYPIPEHMKENAAEDLLHTVELLAKGYYIIFVPKAIAYSQEDLDFKGFVKQTSRWMKGSFYVLWEKILKDKDIIKNLNWVYKLQIGALYTLPYYLALINYNLIQGIITGNTNYLIIPLTDFLFFFGIGLYNYKKYKEHIEKPLKYYITKFPLYYLARNLILIPYAIGLWKYFELKMKRSTNNVKQELDSLSKSYPSVGPIVKYPSLINVYKNTNY